MQSMFRSNAKKSCLGSYTTTISISIYVHIFHDIWLTSHPHTKILIKITSDDWVIYSNTFQNFHAARQWRRYWHSKIRIQKYWGGNTLQELMTICGFLKIKSNCCGRGSIFFQVVVIIIIIIYIIIYLNNFIVDSQSTVCHRLRHLE